MPDQTSSLGIIVEENVPVAMRDGVLLRANVFRPADGCPAPALLVRTPYGKGNSGFERYVRAGYVVVWQDCRGRYASDGDFIPFTVEEAAEVEGRDGYDTVEWLARQPYCNGKVGTMGTSYPAWTQWVLARQRPPHLVAMCARSIPQELTTFDGPGAFRPARRLHWWINNIAPDVRRRHGLPGPHTVDEALAIWNEVERGHWIYFLPWLDLPRYLPEGIAEYVDDWLRHPNRQAWRIGDAYRDIAVPNLDVSGWFDHCNGTMGHLAGMQQDARTEAARRGSRLIIGPWNHSGLGRRKLGDMDFGPPAAVDIDDLTIRWFDYWLKGLDNGIGRAPAVEYFVLGADQWKSADTWPPGGTRDATYFLSSGGDAGHPTGSGLLTPTPPADEASDRYLYDPRDPVPTLWSPELFSGAPDRRALEYRRDILYYRTPPLTEPVEVVGYPEVILHASSSAPDTDFFAALVDERPDGPALQVCSGIVCARHRHSLQRTDFLTPGEVTEFRIRLGPTACRFLAGHRIRLEITSSDFPNYDRNHNVGRNDLADAELVPAQQTVFHSRQDCSRLVLSTQ
ncbi:MAG TPA: CocE/NonD family hydrolase [Armatimonadota bacterium]|nr:CocE/NonD family hydrolase [Armatimonadota bacterium]